MKTNTFKTNLQKHLVLLVFLCFGITNTYSQGLDLRAENCGFNCTSNNFTVVRVYLVDAEVYLSDGVTPNPNFGLELALSNQSCNINDPAITVSIGFEYTSNQNGAIFNARSFADLSIDGVSQVITPYLGQIDGKGGYNPAAFGTTTLLNALNPFSFEWSCGQELSISNVLTTWRTNNSGDYSADDSYDCRTYGKSQCQTSVIINIQAPLSIDASYDACFDGSDTEVTFIPNVNNGMSPYTYEWIFYENGIQVGAATIPPGSINPVFVYTGAQPYSATLLVTDSDGIKNNPVLNIPITVPTQILLTSATVSSSVSCAGGTAEVTIIASGGTGTLSYTFNGETNTTGIFTGVSSGNNLPYTITDESNCELPGTIDVLDGDDEDPTWVNAPANLTVQCDGTPDPSGAFAAWLVSFTATDNSGPLTVTNNSAGLSDDCGATGTETVTFTATDPCGNSIILDATFTIEDTTIPNIDTTASNLTVECDGAGNTTEFNDWLASNGGATATDSCSDVTWSNDFTALSDDCGNTGSATVTFTAEDACGLIATTSATFTIENNTPPALAGGANGTAECTGSDPAANADYIAWRDGFAGITSSDTCGDATISFVEGTWSSLACTDSITVTFTATDDCGLTSNQEQSFTISDTTPPALAGGTNGSAESTGVDPATNANYIAWRDGFAGITDSDICGNTTMSLVEGPWQAAGCGESITVTFTATDECGFKTDQDQMFTISDDTPPTLSGGADGTAECTGSDPAANATYIAWRDNYAGITGSDISGNVIMSSSEGFWNSTGCTDTITVTFTATDECLLTSSQDQIFTISDTTVPTIDTEASDSTVECDGAGNTTALNAWLDSNGGAIASDICADVTWSNNFTSLSDDCGNTGSATVIFTAEDACGLIATTSATFTIIDTTIPAISNVASDQTVQCDGTGNTTEFQSWLDSSAGSIAIDECSDITWTHEVLSVLDECGETSRTLVRFIATDECGNLNTSTALFTIIDLIPPTIDTDASSMTVECDGAGNTAEFDGWLASNGGATASDICAGVTWTNDFTALSDACGTTGTASVIFTATDDCGNTATSSATFTVEDTTPPTIDTDAANSIVECDGAGNTTEFNAWLASNGGAIATDICANVTWSNDFTTLSDDCGATGTATIIFTATDECGNASTSSASFTIEDTTPPTIDTDAANSTVECDGAGNTSEFNAWLDSNGGAIASDVCAGVTWTNDFTALSDDCGATGAAAVIFTATDECGNASTSSATFTIEDTTPPTIDTDASNIIAECDGSGNNGELQTWLDNNGGASASDICAGLTWTNDYGNAASDCSNAISVTFTATDECGNASTSIATYAIQDTTPPTIDTDATNSTVECDGAGNTAEFDAWLASNGGATASDDCSAINWTNDFNALSDDCGATGAATVIFTATDGCGNASTTSATFTIEDTTPPTIDTDAANSTVECDGAGNTAQFDAWLASNGGATASDICAGVTWTNDFTALSDDCGATGTASVIFTATDDCGNAATSSAIFTIEDTTPPTIDTDAANSTVECDGAGNTTEFDAWLAASGNAVASDTCGGVTWSNDFAALSDECGATGTATVIFTAIDACGNTATSSASFTIIDTTPPTMDTDASNITAECDGTGNNGALQAWIDNNGGASASDSCSNVTWTNDYGNAASDCSNAISVIFTATDDCGNTSTTSASYAIQDTTPPSIDTDAVNSTVECDGAGNTTEFDAWLASNGGATASDDCSAINWTNDFNALSDDCGATGAATVIFTATDGCGNASTTSATFTIEDTTPPTIDTDAANSTVECDGAGNTAQFDAWLASNGGATNASDTCSNVTWSNDFTALSDDCGQTGTATIIFTATDDCGNASTSSASFTIEDTTPPTINTDASDSTVECDGTGNTAEFDAWLASNGGTTATDICANVTWTNDFTALSDDCGATGTASVIFTATDDCGNASTSSASFTIVDTMVPELITELQTELTVSCADIPDAPTPGFADDCSDVTVVIGESNSFDGTDNDYEIIRTWTVTDDCNNTAVFTQTLTVTVEEIVTQIFDDACYNDGTIDLDTYLSGQTGGTWVILDSVSNDVDLNGSIFDPSNLENDLGDYVFSYSIAEDGCISVTEVTIGINDSCIVIPCGSEDVEISKAVTPNGDQWNEFFEITGVEACGFTFEVKIFSRWGALIYESNDYQNDWNGTAHRSSIGNSDKVPAGTYYYIVNLKNSGLEPFTGPIYLGTK